MVKGSTWSARVAGVLAREVVELEEDEVKLSEEEATVVKLELDFEALLLLVE